jgi:hypothetical protein
MKELKIKITFTEELLGTASADPEVHREYIASKAPDAPSREEEVAAIGVDEVVERAMTIFPRNLDGKPILFDYQVKGFFKDSCSVLNRLSGKGKKIPVNESGKLTAFKKIIDGLIFVNPRMIPFVFDGEIGSCQRPLRIHTPQGERVALANSETLPAGTTAEFTIIMLDPSHEKAVREWLDYGKLRGIGQWRNSGKGRFEWEEIL